ncbi:hypothetical protein [Streptomyces fagopyri]
MTKPTELSIIRPGSTPLTISLVAGHLPAPVREALEDLVARRGELAAAQQELSSTRGTDWAAANDKVIAATTAAETALTDFASITAGSSTAVRDSSAAAFQAAMDTANARLVEALDALADADRAAQLWHSVKPGRPVLRYATQTATDAKVHREFGMVRSELRDLLSQLPDSID